jgi:protein-tyrosine-phosphatase
MSTLSQEATDRPNVNTKKNILFLCTGNACRSQMAEALLRHLGGDRFHVASAGSRPAGYVHPLATECMKEMGVPMGDQHSKSWDEFSQRPFDAVITLCDDAAGQTCPSWPGAPLRVHWSLPDPAAHPGSGDDQRVMARRLAQRLRTKIEGLIGLDWDADATALKNRLDFLGEI